MVGVRQCVGSRTREATLAKSGRCGYNCPFIMYEVDNARVLIYWQGVLSLRIVAQTGTKECHNGLVSS